MHLLLDLLSGATYTFGGPENWNADIGRLALLNQSYRVSRGQPPSSQDAREVEPFQLLFFFFVAARGDRDTGVQFHRPECNCQLD